MHSIFVVRSIFVVSHQRQKIFNVKFSQTMVCFICAQHNHSVKNGVFTKDLHFYAPDKTIYSQNSTL